MAKILLGKPVAEVIRNDIKERVAALGTKGVTPTILVLRVGARAEDVSYERGILKTAGNLGIKIVVDEISESITTDEMIKKVEAANEDASIHGIMMFRPLPRSIDEDAVIEAISPAKDIDCMTNMNLAGVFAGKDVFAPCTAEAVIEMLKFNNVNLNGAKVALLGRSMVVGKPLSMLLLKENATVTICHSRTTNRKDITNKADIVISAMGQPRLLGPIDFSREAYVIDVGVNDDGNGGICGDVDYDLVLDYVLAINPAIGGLGTITTSLLLKHAVVACEKANS
ncbi:MAG: bifunctional 5,10-methylene-tetrahydrofolate dehydrogenase/5,10-methylene-tetrahydrofolate cyclohydrolase [Lachnospiraceae bacterium]|nr:bifunctional 5,10-methylene-tetrahydrofolate dehydrogenase/5,10-methylene-tetrahydrofolate cyclohydrolase [Lachnospiraceae bacterium]